MKETKRDEIAKAKKAKAEEGWTRSGLLHQAATSGKQEPPAEMGKTAMTAAPQSIRPSTEDDYAYRFQYADGSAFQIYADGTAFVVSKDGRREQKFGVIDSRIQLLMGRVAKPRQDEIVALRAKVDELTARELMILAHLYKDAPLKVANLCDDVLDRSGGLLGRVRDRARSSTVNSQHSDGEAGR